MAEQKTAAQIATTIKEAEIVSLVAQTQTKIDSYVERNEINFPPNYSVGNALRAAQFMIMDIQDIHECTTQSIANAILSMAVQGLNSTKKQCYFIKRGNKLSCDRSYFGSVALAKRLDPTIEDIIARPVRKGENFLHRTNLNGTDTVLQHQQTLESMDSKEFIGGYATIIYKAKTKKETVSKVMTMQRIQASWDMSASIKDAKAKGKTTIHDTFTDEMIQRTLLNSITKKIINESDDGSILYEILEATGMENAESQAYEVIERNANQQPLIDVIIDEETGGIYDNDTIIEQSDIQPIETQQEPINEVTEQGKIVQEEIAVKQANAPLVL